MDIRKKFIIKKITAVFMIVFIVATTNGFIYAADTIEVKQSTLSEMQNFKKVDDFTQNAIKQTVLSEVEVQDMVEIGGANGESELNIPEEPSILEDEWHFNDDNNDAEPYLQIGIIVNGKRKGSGLDGWHSISVTEYSSYSIYATYVDYVNGKPIEKDVDVSSCQWYGEGEIDINNMGTLKTSIDSRIERLLTKEAQEKTLSFRATYQTPEGNVLQSSPCKIKIQKLKLDSKQREVLQYAAICLAVGTNFSSEAKGKRIEEILTDLNQTTDYISKDKQSGATFASFYSTTISDWELVEYNSSIISGFYTALFQDSSQNYILAFRGTNDILDVWNDWKLGTGQVGLQMKQALEYYDELSQRYGKIVKLTGHSLGGGLANYISDLRNVEAITFNAPSTMVSAINGSIGHITREDFSKNFIGVDQKRRIDYVNFHDWVGNTGIGDNKASTSSQMDSLQDILNMAQGSGGLIDRTIFVEDQSRVNGKGNLPFHSFEQLLLYNIEEGKISLQTQGATNPKTISFTYRDSTYVLGTQGNDKLNFIANLGDGYVFGGRGNDEIRLYATGIKASKIDVFIVGGGAGNDTITDNTSKNVEYYYFSGDGLDTINDNGGSDVIEVYGYNDEEIKIDNKYIEVSDLQEENEHYYITIRAGNKDIIKADIKGKGKYTIKNGDTGKTIETVKRIAPAEKQITETSACPINMYIYDISGNLVCELLDGQEIDEYYSYGHFSVVNNGDEFIKSATLFEEGYTIKLIGIENGTMCHTSTILSDDTIIIRTVENIPVVAGAVYTTVSEADNDVILKADLNGDGVEEQNIVYYIPSSLALNIHEKELHYGESVSLAANIYPADAFQDVVWSSSDTNVAAVDEFGLVTAVGSGVAKITSTSIYDNTILDVCTITVPEERFSLEECVILGVEESYLYTGEPIVPELEIRYGSYILKEGIDYSIDCTNNIESGIVTITIVGKGVFEGSITQSFIILPQLVEEKVQQLVAQCLESGAETDYDKALWFHDWLIYNANYDYTYTEYSAEGVLLKGKGVCQSYAEAYHTLLDEVGVENIIVTAPEMDHAWNIIKIDGVYTHVDCTWDDPNSGGFENRTYFGLGDNEMQIDHLWDRTKYPFCEKLKANISEDTLPEAYDLQSPIVGIDFGFADVSGKIITRQEVESSNSNILLIYGRPTCPNTMALLNALSDWKDILENHGVQVMAVMENKSQVAELSGNIAFPCVYEVDSGYEKMRFYERIDLTSSFTFPEVILQNSQGYVYYRSTGYVYEPERLVATAISDLPVSEQVPYSSYYFGTSEAEIEANIKDALTSHIDLIKLCDMNNDFSEDKINAVMDFTLQICEQYRASIEWYMPFSSQFLVINIKYNDPLEKPVYIVSFDIDGGSFIADLEVKENDRVYPPTIPLKPGYVFKGWYIDKECTKEYDFDTPVTSNFKLYAGWEKVPTEITEVIISQTELSLEETKTIILTASVLPEDAADKTIIWSSSDASVATVENGKVTAVKEGTAIITAASVNGKSAVCIVTVTKSGELSKKKLADVLEGSWQYAPALYVYEKGVMTGKGLDKDGNIIFAPNDMLTREQFAQILYSAEGKPNVVYSSKFKDVKENQWYTNAVIWAAEQGIVSGYGNGIFGVGNNITREQLALMLYKYAQMKGYDITGRATFEKFIDASDISGWAREQLQWAVANGIMSGKGEKLDPIGNATRAECAAMLRTFIIKFEK